MPTNANGLETRRVTITHDGRIHRKMIYTDTGLPCRDIEDVMLPPDPKGRKPWIAQPPVGVGVTKDGQRIELEITYEKIGEERPKIYGPGGRLVSVVSPAIPESPGLRDIK